MPYEQYMGQATPASDLFAMAATFLHVLTGRPPRDFMNDEGRIEVPEALPGEPRLRSVIARLLRPSPAERFASAREVRNALVGSGPSTAVTRTPASRFPLHKFVESTDAVFALPLAPRPLTGATKELMEASTPGALRLMSASEKGEEYWTLGGFASLAFFSVITAGILPMVFLQMASVRRRRMRRFFRDGTPAIAEVMKMELQETAFDEKLTRVAYQFEADGALHRDSDTVLPVIADRWQVGDQVPILYIAGRGTYDSVIVASE